MRHLWELFGARMPAAAWFVIGVIFLSAAGTFLVVPFLAVHLAREAHLPSATIGTLFALSLVTSRGLPVLTGPLSDRIGALPAMTAGLALLGAAYVALAFAGTPVLVGAVLTVMGIGVALFQPSSKSVLGAGLEPAARSTAFAWRSVAFNAGAALGAGVGALLLSVLTRPQLFLAAGALYGLLLCTLVLVVHAPATGTGTRRPPVRGLAAGLRDGRLLGLTALAAGFWMLYAQVNLTLPLALDRAGLDRLIGAVLSANAVLVIALQVPVSAASRRLGMAPAVQIAWGFVGTGLGLGCLALLGLPWLAIGLFVVVYSLGEMLVAPNLDTMTSALAPAELAGTYFGVASLGWVAGGIAGNLLGGLLLDVGGRGLLWETCVPVGLLLALAAWRWLALGYTRDEPVARSGRLPA